MGNRNKKKQVKDKRQMMTYQEVANIIEEFTLINHKVMKKRIYTKKK
tara:strand:- start:824 stop:964 length:141 start_codon:yes stop_codon:yes gene_type:complete